ncbi:MAG: S-layer homology domain-containing protein, partial [Oscillospiraceae bacterium]|nr:S-layer homology domain-containing protein [Oscillospiraceae bacterium]
MRRFLAAALIVLLCLSLIIPAHAQSTSQNPFTDVQPGDWFYNAVQYVFDNEIMVGTSPTTFVPHAELSRAMVVTILHRMEGEPSVTFRPIFNDVAPDRWYSAAVTWAYDAGIVEGIGGGRFAPNNPITREQLATMMYRLAEDRGYDLNVPGNFSMTGIATDANLVSSWAYEAMCWASFNGFIFTINGALHPQTSASRAETAVFVYRFSGQEAETPTPVPTPTPPPPAVVPPNATAEEWRMFEHVNELRAAHSAPPIQWCNCLGA